MRCFEQIEEPRDEDRFTQMPPAFKEKLVLFARIQAAGISRASKFSSKELSHKRSDTKYYVKGYKPLTLHRSSTREILWNYGRCYCYRLSMFLFLLEDKGGGRVWLIS